MTIYLISIPLDVIGVILWGGGFACMCGKSEIRWLDKILPGRSQPDRNQPDRDWRRDPRVGDIIERPRYRGIVRYRIRDVSAGKGRKIHGPGYAGLESADDPDCNRISMCGTQWLKWSADAVPVKAARNA